MTANPAVKGFCGLQEEYLPVLIGMEHTGIAVADMTTLHKSLLASKRYYDMSGNNANHPNDFLHELMRSACWLRLERYKTVLPS